MQEPLPTCIYQVGRHAEAGCEALNGDARRTVTLHASITGRGNTPVVLLHGLFGSISNMRSLARGLESDYRVISLDLRNHGLSEHNAAMSYEDMAADVLSCLRQQGMTVPFVLIGHSMGGKVAMSCALLQAVGEEVLTPLIRAVVVLDIAPVVYRHDFGFLVRALQDVSGQLHAGRRRVNILLKNEIPDPTLRSFLLKNMVRDSRTGFRWRINLPAIGQNLSAIHGFPSRFVDWHCNQPSLFLAGERSDYLDEAHCEELCARFPLAEIARIKDAGHWLHTEQPRAVLDHIQRFLAASPVPSSMGEQSGTFRIGSRYTCQERNRISNGLLELSRRK